MTTSTVPATPPVGAVPPPVPPREPRATLRTVGMVVGALLVGVGALQLADLVSADPRHETADYEAEPTVELVTDGRVTVVAGDGDTVEVERTWRQGLAPVDLAVRHEPGRLVLQHTCGWWIGTCSVATTLAVPEGTAVHVRSSDGAVVVADLVGDVQVRTGDGTVEVRDVVGDVDVDSGDGALRVRGVDGDVRASTGDGRLEVAAVTGALRARSGDGSVHVDGVGADAVVSTGDGSVQVAAVGGDVEARTDDGRVTVRGPGVAVALDIATDDGATRVEAPTDPASGRSVLIRSGDGDVEYLAP